MTLVPLGRTDVQVPPLGLGLFQIGRNTNAGYLHHSAIPSDEEVEKLILTAGECGVTLLDTAPSYGSSEKRLGEAMRKLGWPFGRDSWVISTKVGERYTGKESYYSYSDDFIHRSIGDSLRDIGTDYLDVVLIHSDGRDEHILKHTGAVRILQEYKEHGHIRAMGISAKTVDGAMLAIKMGVDVLMIELTPYKNKMLAVIERAIAKKVGLMIKRPLGSGHLANARGSVGKCFQYLKDVGVFAAGSAVVGTLNPIHLRANADTMAGVIQGDNRNV